MLQNVSAVRTEYEEDPYAFARFNFILDIFLQHRKYFLFSNTRVGLRNKSRRIVAGLNFAANFPTTRRDILP